MRGLYTLDANRNPVRCASIFEWGSFMQAEANRLVELTKFGGTHISTVFIGLDYSFKNGPPLVFETAILSEGVDVVNRYATWNEAEAGHAEAVAAYKAFTEGGK
jgi:hypothetical protein